MKPNQDLGESGEPRISYTKFTLPFLRDTDSESDPDAGEEERSRGLDLENFTDQVPDDAIFLGSIDSRVGNWCEWKVDDHLYLLPWTKGRFDWALFRITWDDNWGRYDWCPEARIAGAPDPNKACELLLRGVFKKWGIDLRRSDSQPYRNLLE